MGTSKLWWTIFAVSFVATATVETFLPLRSFSTSTPRRWFNNSILLVASSLILAGVHQLAGIALAFSVQASAFGLLNHLSLPYWSRFAIGFAALDLTIYLAHRMNHANALLWRVHQVHHSETDLDLMSGLRFHPFEVLISQGARFICIALLGVPPAAVASSALAGVVVDFYSHANVRIPEALDRFFRLLIVTPAMHRMHHADELPRQQANFGTVFSVWDRLFGTYQANPSASASPLRTGLAEIAEGSSLSSVALLLLPFRRQTPVANGSATTVASYASPDRPPAVDSPSH